jgi:hypothetical protein
MAFNEYLKSLMRYGWLQISATAFDDNWTSGTFIQYLRKHVSKTPAFVGDLYLKMLNAGTYPHYKTEDIKAIVQALYDAGEKDTANKICNIYFSKGFELLKEIFQLNNIPRI